MGEAKNRGTKAERITNVTKYVKMKVANTEENIRIALLYRLAKKQGQSDIAAMAVAQSMQAMWQFYIPILIQLIRRYWLKG
jgi:hypothetical protein